MKTYNKPPRKVFLLFCDYEKNSLLSVRYSADHFIIVYPNEEQPTFYRRELRISNAIALTLFQKGRVNYLREAFTSFTEDVGVIRLTTDAEHALNLFWKKSRNRSVIARRKRSE